LAERAAWQFVEDQKPTWDLVTINPPYVFGVRWLKFLEEVVGANADGIAGHI
jgi:hypothetical protein